MMKRRRDEGFSLIELMMVIAVIGILATALIPQFGEVKTAAKITGVETNIRSVVIHISGMSSSEDIYDSLDEVMDTMSNPITNRTGVGTSRPSSRTQTQAIYVIDTEDDASDYHTDTRYNGAVIVYEHNDFSADVFACDERGRIIDNLSAVVER